MLCFTDISVFFFFFFFKQKTAYEMRISDWSSDVCSSDLLSRARAALPAEAHQGGARPDHGDRGRRTRLRLLRREQPERALRPQDLHRGLFQASLSALQAASPGARHGHGVQGGRPGPAGPAVAAEGSTRHLAPAAPATPPLPGSPSEARASGTR